MTSATTTVAGYLLTRLAQAGVRSVFGVPGEDNLGLLDAIEAARPTMEWIGTATEQGAAYAAGGYARHRGLSAVVTTFGVGEMSALNAIAAGYAESVPVVHIVGTPALPARRAGAARRHDLPGGDYGHFARMAAGVTVAQADLRPQTAPDQIDRVLRLATLLSRPVYIAVPADVAGADAPAPKGRLPEVGEAAQASPAFLALFTAHARQVLSRAPTASVLVGHLAARYRVTGQVRELAAAGDLPVAVLPAAKGEFPESDPLFAGLYAGAASAKRARVAVEDHDLLITVGADLTDTVTVGGAGRLPDDRIDLAPGQARIGGAVYPVRLRQALATLAAVLRDGRIRPGSVLRHAPIEPPEADTAPDATGILTQRRLWAGLQEFLRPGDLVLAGQGTAFYGAAGLTLPDGAQLTGQPVRAPAGWAVPAALGAMLAAPDRRLILLTGDGAMQQTAPELGTLLAQGLAPVIIVLSNDGHTTARAISSPAADYHDIPAWDWTMLPATVAPGSDAVALRAGDPRELAWALNAAAYHAGAGRPVLIEAVLGRADTPPLLTDLMRVTAARAA